MAYNDSGNLGVGAVYTLGGYTFQLRVQNSHEPGEPDVVSVFAICRGPDGTRETQAVDFPAGTTVEGWSVEANETEASVYVTVEGSKVDPGAISLPIPCASTGHASDGPQGSYDSTYGFSSGDGLLTNYLTGLRSMVHIWASSSPGAVGAIYNEDGSVWSTHPLLSTYTANGKTVYYSAENGSFIKNIISLSPACNGGSIVSDPVNNDAVAWLMIYGAAEEDKEYLVARFAIDIRTADGGPGGDWDEPGSDGDPNKTLYVTVTGANGGSATGTPPEREAQERYGSGGDGGHGGGGGAGASTVIIYEFATSRARRVVQEAHTSGPGVGGPGGKGGRGGPGCILIFY